MFPKPPVPNSSTNQLNNLHYENNGFKLYKKINNLNDASKFRSTSPSYKNICTYVQLLCDRIVGTSNKVFNSKYTIQDETIKKCSELMKHLVKSCEETDLKLAKSAQTLRFGHVAYRDWHDSMKLICRKFIDEELISNQDQTNLIDGQYKEELFVYLIESFGNRMRIDYGTGHELNFIIFTMGFCNLVQSQSYEGSPATASTQGDTIKESSQGARDLSISEEKLKLFVEHYGWDVLWLFAKDYLNLCRQVQKKFRLEPAGSRGVYNMDDFQFLPFLFGTAQLIGVKYISSKNFHHIDQVNQFKSDFIFFEAISFILDNKRGPFNEHSYTLWGFLTLGSWDNIFRRIKSKFNDDVLTPFPITQHFLFGEYILRWE